MRLNRIIAGVAMLLTVMMGTLYVQLVKVSVKDAQEAGNAEIREMLKMAEHRRVTTGPAGLNTNSPGPNPAPIIVNGVTLPPAISLVPEPLQIATRGPALINKLANIPQEVVVATAAVTQPPSPPQTDSSMWGLLPNRAPPHPDIERMWYRSMNTTEKFRGACSMQVPVVTMYGGFIEDIFTALETNKSFGWVRLGDGEVSCLTNSKEGVVAGAHCTADTKIAFKKSIAALPHLRNVFTSIGTWWLCHGTAMSAIHNSLFSFLQTGTDMLTRKYAFFDSFYLPYGNSDGPEQPGIVRSCRGRDVVLIGPKQLEKITTGDMFNIVNHIYVPAQGRIFNVMPALNEAGNYAANRTNLVFLVAFGVHAKILIVQGTQMMPGHTFIDVGSSLDAYVGIRSRDYNRDLKKFCDGWPRWMGKGVCAGLNNVQNNNRKRMNALAQRPKLASN
eukprot:TRINITY_DN9010_c0_g2_i1.p1 TRINITY_DN9010_c0_g2~~TRINITY_DN9010_c0_g2_i1.p1  ORF type:complete len:445 (+),score=90.36 TRINITY_DN9010_c0_g2_i1:89-1423(+)